MSGSGRRRRSKWDLEEDILPDHCDSACSNKDRSSFHEHGPSDHMPGRRDIQRAECMNEESIPGFGGDGQYVTTGLDGQRQQRQTQSPRRSRGRSYRSWSRSRSRSASPAHNPQPEPSLDDQNSRSGHSAPLCRDFAAGRCRKGYLCQFAHHGRLDHESRKHLERRVGSHREALTPHSNTYFTGGRSTNICNDFLKGRCRRGASCKYAHHDSGSDEFGKGTSAGSYQDGDNDDMSKDGHRYDHKPRHSSETLCKFFAAGNCRNGRHCKFSHHHNKHVYPEKISPDERQPKHNLDGMHGVQREAKWGETTSPGKVPKAHGGTDDVAQGASTEIPYAPGLMQADACGDNMQQNPSTFVENNASSCVDLSGSSDIASGQGIHQINESFSAAPITCVNGVRQSQPTLPIKPTMEGMQIPYHQAALGSKSAEGGNQTSPSHHQVGEGMQKSDHEPVFYSKPDDGAYMANPDVSQVGSWTTPSQSSALGGQLLQISNLSTTLAVMNNGSDLPDSSASVPLVSAAASELNQAAESIRQYNPICDSIETKVPSTSNKLLSNSLEQRISLSGTSEIPSSNSVVTSFVTGEMPNSSDFLKVGSSGDELGHPSPKLNLQVPVSKEEENGDATGKGANEAQGQEPREDMAVNGGVNDAKNVKGMRPFRFGLAEFVKELLRPTWKEGQMSKEVYKTVVKKVVDKVTDSFQADHIPQTKEKIDQYLSFSKPKLSKLVQAYLEKYQKPSSRPKLS